VQFRNSFGTETAFEAAMKLLVTLNIKGLGGGRDRTRTCDLLRVKHYLNSNLIDGTDTSIYVFGVIIV